MGNGNPLQYSCLENPMDGVGYYTRLLRPWSHKESDTTEQLHFHLVLREKNIEHPGAFGLTIFADSGENG